MNEGDEIGPPVEPVGERELAEDAAFLAACRAALDDLPMTRQWKIGPQLLTRNDRWGLVWRADFEMSGESLKPLVNRLICWRQKGGDIALAFAIGQSVSPLGAADAPDQGPGDE